MPGVVEVLVIGVQQEVRAVHHRAVHGLAVDELRHRLAHLEPVERRAAHVHREALEADRRVVAHATLQHQVARELVGARALGVDARGVDREDVDPALAERLESVLVLREVPHHDAVEVAESAALRQVLAPPAPVAAELGLDLLDRARDEVGAAGDRACEVELVEVAPLEGVPRQNPEGRAVEDVAPVLRSPALLHEPHRVLVHDLGAFEEGEGRLPGAGVAPRVRHRVEGPLHVRRGYRAPVGPLRARIELKDELASVLRRRPAPRQRRHRLAGLRVRLEQRLVHEAEDHRGVGVVVHVGVEALRGLRAGEAQRPAATGARRRGRIRAR